MPHPLITATLSLLLSVTLLPAQTQTPPVPALADILRAFGARFSSSLVLATGDLRESALVDAIDLFVRAGHVEVRQPGELAEKKRRKRVTGPVSHGPDVVYVVPDDARLSLDLAKNIVVHFFVVLGRGGRSRETCLG